MTLTNNIQDIISKLEADKGNTVKAYRDGENKLVILVLQDKKGRPSKKPHDDLDWEEYKLYYTRIE